MSKNNDVIMLTVKDTARRCHVKERTVRNWYAKRGLKVRKAGGRVLIHPDDLENFMKKN
jgi:excisionase family DNA binding protein